MSAPGVTINLMRLLGKLRDTSLVDEILMHANVYYAILL